MWLLSEQTETRSSVGSRKCVSSSAMGCSVWRYSRYVEMSSGSGGERDCVSLNDDNA